MSTKTGECILFLHSERKVEPAVPHACKAGVIQALGFDEFASLSPGLPPVTRMPPCSCLVISACYLENGQNWECVALNMSGTA